MNPVEESLAARAKRGDQQAFEGLVRLHKDTLYRFCRRYVGDPDDAYDVVQEAFAAAWLALHRYDPQRPFSAWLRKIALNKCRDLGRRGSVRRSLILAFEREQPSRTSCPSVTLPADADSERLDRLDEEIAALPPAYKAALLLTTLGDMSQQEAATTLGISVKALEMRVYRAKRKLAARLGREADDG